MRRIALSLCLIAVPWSVFGQAASTTDAASSPAEVTAPVLTPSEKLRFLESAAIMRVRPAGKGIAGTQRATLSSGSITHDASIQMIDQSKAAFQSAKRVELNFRDYWGFNVAAYRLGVMLGLDMIPPSVARRFRTQQAAYTWWVEDVILDEQERLAQKRLPPDVARWSAQHNTMRVFDELIANTDRNQGNLLIDKHWKVWLIDHTRAFRTTETLQSPKSVMRCEKSLLEAMKALSFASMREQLDDYLTRTQIEAILKRRDLLVSRIESFGPSAVY